MGGDDSSATQSIISPITILQLDKRFFATPSSKNEFPTPLATALLLLII
jgi:hypothetical protein